MKSLFVPCGACLQIFGQIEKKLYSFIKFWKTMSFFVVPPEKLTIMANMLRKMYKSVNFSEVHKDFGS